jgi:hypothetical protein
MKRIPKIFLFLLFCSSACTNNDSRDKVTSENNVDAARNFIRAALDGKFNEARSFMLADSLNTQYLDAVERNYSKMPPDTMNAYRGASIRFYPPTTQVNDSTTIIIYANSFKNDLDTLRVIKINGQWLVDLKYLFEHDADTSFQKPVHKDTLK